MSLYEPDTFEVFCNYIGLLEAKSKAKSLLNYASLNGELKMVKYLVEQGVKFHEEIPLRWSAAAGHHEVVKYLLDHGADIHIGDDFPLREASRRGSVETVKVLLEYGANIHALNDHALVSAAENNHLEVVKLLLENGANLKACDFLSFKLSGPSEVAAYLFNLKSKNPE